MSVEFRKRSTGEILQMMKRRKWHILLPALAVGFAVAWVVWKMPGVYESTTFLNIRPPTISDKVVQSLTDEDLTQRLQTIGQEVLSRSSLEPMVTKYRLFEAERASGVPIEIIVDKMRRNIVVEPEKTDREKISGFRITYRDRSPETARNVTAELASKYVNEQVVSSTQSAETTSDFINSQLAQAKSNLDALEKQRLEIMTRNVETLPESSQGLIAQLQGLRQREETISKEKETLIMEKGRLNDNIRALNSQARIVEDFGEKETQDATAMATRVEDTPAYAQLIRERAKLQADLDTYKTTLRDKHPKIIETNNQLKQINDEIDELKKNTEQRVQDANRIGTRKAELQKKNLEIEKQRIESQISQTDQQIQSKEEEARQNAAVIASLEAKINTIPDVKVALEGVTTQYQSAKTAYDELLKKYNSAQGQVQRETNAQGETIRVVDPANLPQTPVNASKRPLFILLGIAAGLGLGLLLAAVFEVPNFSRIQNVEDMKYYTGLPVLASVPPLLTGGEISRQKYVNWLKVLAALIVTVASIPLLIAGLQMSHIFERMI